MDFNGKQILVVDDEKMVRDTLSDYLSLNGATVVVAENGNKAFDLMMEMDIDVVLSDVRMPESSGLDLLDKVKASNKSMPPIVLISAFQALSRSEMIERGAKGFILKTQDYQKVKELLVEVLNS